MARLDRHKKRHTDPGGRAPRLLRMLAQGAVGVLLVGVLSALMPATAANAESSTISAASNPFYVYVKQGELLYASSAGLGVVRDQNSAVATSPGDDTYGPATEDGIWEVNVSRVNSASSMRPWSISARTAAGVDVPGRVWSNLYGTYQGAAADLQYWLVNNSGYRYQVSFRGYNGIQSRIRADAIGNPVVKPQCLPSYQSKQSDFLDSSWDRVIDCGDPVRIFFAEPAADLPATAMFRGAQIPVLPAPIERDDIVATDLSFAPTVASGSAGAFSWHLNSRITGAYWLQIDVDGDGSYDGPKDRRIPQYANGSGSYSYAFDGRDGEGEEIADCTSMHARIFFDKIGEIHVVQDDVENRSGGIEMIRTNGPASPDPTIYWDDTKLPGTRANTTPVLDGTAGVDSTGGVHGWNYNLNSWGNDRVIEDWTFAPVDKVAGEIAIGGTANCVELTKTSTATAATRVGDAVTYTVTATNTGATAYTADNPAVVFDDLSGVLDDATYNADATASEPGTLAYTSPRLSWTGALGAGQSVTLRYTVTVKAGGDGVAKNIAWVPTDPQNPVTPRCELPAGTTTDPVTGEPCAVASFALPKLTITKTADRTQLPAVGENVTYTITATNVGPGDYTDEKPATFVDDLSGVLDDATFAGTATATTGSTTYAAPNLSWKGALGSQQSATITYTVTYTGAGDARVQNVVCVPASETATGSTPCASVDLPGARLTQWKSVVSSDTPAVAGSALTYTLHFDNDGSAAATVDSVDLLTHVLDDADVTVEPVATSGLTAVRDGERIAITGTVQPGAEATVTYTVTVKPDGRRGDDIAANFLLTNDPLNPPVVPTTPACTPADTEKPNCTSTPIAAVTYAKTVSASSDPVAAGTVLTYTVTVRSTGRAAATVSRDDVLTDVLDDTTLTAAPVSSVATVTAGAVEDGRFHIGGTLAGGAIATVIYQVTVNDAGARGNNTADNFLVPAGANPPGSCAADSDQCTVTPLPAISVTKSADPATGTKVAAGDKVTYTLTFRNTGLVTGGADYTDDLSGVLDDATLTGDIVSSDTSVEGVVTAASLRVTGAIAPETQVTVVYSVEVKPDAEQGDHALRNVVVITGADPICDESGSNCTEHPITPTPVPSSPAAPVGTLPVTGGTLSPWMLALILLVPVGAGAVVASRVRRKRGEEG